jgi:hypothetical protein
LKHRLEPREDWGLRRVDLRRRFSDREEFGAVNFREGLLSARSRRPFLREGVARYGGAGVPVADVVACSPAWAGLAARLRRRSSEPLRLSLAIVCSGNRASSEDAA